VALAPARSFVNGFDEAIAFIHYAFIFWIPLGSSSSCGHCIQTTGLYCWHDVIPLRHICMRIASSQRCYLFQGILCTFYVVSSVPFGVYDMHNHMQCCNIKSCSSASAVSVQSVVFSKLITAPWGTLHCRRGCVCPCTWGRPVPRWQTCAWEWGLSTPSVTRRRVSLSLSFRHSLRSTLPVPLSLDLCRWMSARFIVLLDIGQQITV